MTRGGGSGDNESAKDIPRCRKQTKEDQIKVWVVTQLVLLFEDQARHYTIKDNFA